MLHLQVFHLILELQKLGNILPKCPLLAQIGLQFVNMHLIIINLLLECLMIGSGYNLGQDVLLKLGHGP